MSGTVKRTPFELENAEGLPLRGDVWTVDGARSDAAIVVCHGFKGFKDWGAFPYICERFASDTKLPTVAFNFSGNGVGADLMNFTELHRFEANTFSKELDDLKLVLDTAASGELPAMGAPSAFGLLGHSRGAGIVVIKTAEDERVRALVTWAGTADFNRWSEETRREWREAGRLEVLNARTKQLMPLGIGLLEDTERNADRLNITGAASRLRAPYLVIHGTADESVPAREGRRLSEAAPANVVTLKVIEGAGHTFGAVHPFAGTTDHLEVVIRLSGEFFSEHL